MRHIIDRLWSIFGTTREIRSKSDEIEALAMDSADALKIVARHAGDKRLEAEADNMIRERRRTTRAD